MLHREILAEMERLGAETLTVDLILAALEGEESVERVLGGGRSPNAGDRESDAGQAIPSVYLQDITVSGFRGIGPQVRLEIPPGPGLTVVIGRNGSGKSSFAEALEVLLTGDTLRWSDKRGPWKEGWKNLHHSSGPRITARFQAEGKGGHTTVDAVWRDDADIGGVRLSAYHHGEPHSDLAGIGWEIPLDLYRPLLSYNELAIIGAGPSTLFDTLTAALGLEPLVEARKPLAAARLTRSRLNTEVTRERIDRLVPVLQDVDDPRAEAAVAGLKKRKRDLDELDRLACEPGAEQSSLRRLAELKAPDQEEVLQIAGELEAAQSVVSGLEGGEAEQAERVAGLLESALEHHGQHGDNPCPVCGAGHLDSAWRRSTQEQAERLHRRASRYRKAIRRRDVALRAAGELVSVPAMPPTEAVDTFPLRAAWTRWGSLPADTAKVPEHLLAGHEEVARQAAAVAGQARTLHSEREEKWAEASSRLKAWVAKARTAEASMEAVGRLKEAEAALKEVTETLRNARWSPIEFEALGLWRNLRLQSNVDLRSVELAGSGPRRRVELTVDVDGTEAPALAVVSQGELSCLALSLFFPRATLPESPFRFLVIDDPVQAMDPARVDGLAGVFARIAQHRQLVVFTHDDRLPEALRRMKIEHTCKKVTRRPGSVVEVSDSHDPVTQYFRDAWAVIQDRHLPHEIARRVIPGFCREGLEAACVETVRRRRLGRGESHAEVENALEAAQRLIPKGALALFDDISRGGDVSRDIRRRWGANFEDAFWDANRGTHRAHRGSLRQLISDCQALAARFRSL